MTMTPHIIYALLGVFIVLISCMFLFYLSHLYIQLLTVQDVLIVP